jgi:hypothetical protein
MRYAVVLLVLGAVFAALGCGEEFMTTDMASSANANGYILTLAATPDNLNVQAGGAVTIVAEIIGPDDNGVGSAVVTLTTTLGALAESELTTDADGFAVTTLTAGEEIGYGIVVATYKGAQAMVKVNFWSSSTEGGT